MSTETIEVTGHIVDSLLLAKILDEILDAGCDYEISEFRIGKTSLDASEARIEVTGDDDVLGPLLDRLQIHGANRLADADARLVPADADGVLPAGFYSTTNLATDVRVSGRWLAVENPEMDCALVVADGHARTVPMHRVRVGDRVVVGSDGVRVHAPAHARGTQMFEFMASEVSSEKPKALLVARVAERLRATRERGGKILVVAGPAVVHTGGASDLARLVAAGWVDVLFAGNGFAAHDIEASVLGTSLGVSVAEGVPTEGGHANHIRVINEVRRHGSIAAAVEAGFVTGGVMHACVTAGVPFVLGGSIRDDGPLPDVVADTVAAADALREHIPGVGAALMLASTLHAIATGNCLPAGVETFCVDINQAVVTKLADRGSHQALGIVTDVGPFVRQLAEHLLAT
ncbi:MAG TPA: TIGR00300 family protein [Acidimicrobiales bacterium]|jgi:lysine-ketoglutarate reductase/saccharopine dehydrogenase-like protein (TIGR00300 family)|nr:TIGR00300 family protein [Acidimicrobiales bacterium]